jgi:hypothetical protein
MAVATPVGGRSWLLVHGPDQYCLEWDDGERLLALSSAIRASRLEPQDFTFVPRDSAKTPDRVTLFVTGDDPFELLTQYDSVAHEQASHWFG